jgi:uncharacterized membrane protein YciS (DUF1049 family)
MKKDDWCGVIIVSLILANILNYFVGFDFLLAHPEYRWWIIGTVVAIVIICFFVLHYLEKQQR